eukprot:9493526-Pyramimonas_sp.AAC.1
MDDYVTMRQDLQSWAAMWMDDLVFGPRGDNNWMRWCEPFLDEMFRRGGNHGPRVALLRWFPRRTLAQIIEELCARAWRQAAPRRMAFLQRLADMPHTD